MVMNRTKMRFFLRILAILLGIGFLCLWTRMLHVLSTQGEGPYVPRIIPIEAQYHKEEPKYSSVTSDTFLHVQQLRKKRLRHFCLRKTKLNNFHTRRNAQNLLSSMAVNAKLQMVYCKVTAVGIHNWEHLLEAIEGRAEITIETPVVAHPHQGSVSTSSQLSGYNMSMLETVLRSYTKVIFVRDPFERLVSAYMEGFAGEITFNQFIENVLNLDYGQEDDSWKPLTSMCHPCLLRYDYIMMYGFLRTEVHHLLKRLGLPDGIFLPEFSDTQAIWTHRWLTENLFVELTTQQRKQLLEAFSWDFEAFPFYSSLLWNNSTGVIR
ncbi:carbohydrate sulfotransferase 9-like isoform X2 [Ascaphus truei]